MASFETPNNALESLLRVAESSITVRDLTTTQLWSVAGNEQAADIAALMDLHRFDVAPVAARRIASYVEAEVLRGRPGVASDAASPIATQHLVSSSLPLSEMILCLEDRPWYFVLDHSQVTSLITRADLQLPAVSTVIFGFVTVAEASMNQLIEHHLGGDWEQLLTHGRIEAAKRIHALRLAHNAEITLLECIQMCDRFDLIATQPQLVASLGFTSKRSFETFSKEFAELRNTLAHGGNLLDAHSDPLQGIGLFRAARGFAQRASELASDLEMLWDAYSKTVVEIENPDWHELVGENPTALPDDIVHVITAFNPRSQLRTSAINLAAQASLATIVQHSATQTWGARGSSPDGAWTEQSIAATGLTRTQACTIGSRFGQLGIFELSGAECRVVACSDEAVMRATPRRHVPANP